MIERDFYSGFEGEPELIFELRRSGQVKFRVRAWVGHVNHLLDVLEASPEGWTGILKHHHLHTGWNEDAEWTDGDVLDSIEKMRAALSICDDSVARTLGEELVHLMGYAHDGEGEVVWRLD